MTERLSTATGRALHLLGDRWTLLILRGALVDGTQRYGEWRDRLGISDSVLSSRLKLLVDEGVFALSRYEVHPPRFEYRLTDEGLELWQLLVALWGWEREWVEGARRHAIAVVHTRCDADAHPQLTCAACRRTASLYDIRTTVTPTGRGWLAVPEPVRRRTSSDVEAGATTVFGDETMAMLGDRWSATVVALSLLGARRFADFEQAVRVSPTLLSQRLRGLVELGVLTTVPARDGSRRRHYQLTPKGRAFFPPVVLLLDWADRWFSTDGEPTVAITHLPCGKAFHPALACGTCARRLRRRDVRYVMPKAPAAPRR